MGKHQRRKVPRLPRVSHGSRRAVAIGRISLEKDSIRRELLALSKRR